jgi:hypothetical protein
MCVLIIGDTSFLGRATEGLGPGGAGQPAGPVGLALSVLACLGGTALWLARI